MQPRPYTGQLCRGRPQFGWVFGAPEAFAMLFLKHSRRSFMFAALVLVGSFLGPAANATAPKVGDRAVFDVSVRRDVGELAYTTVTELAQFDEENQRFLLR